MRTAICISGHLRDFRDLSQNWFDMFLEPFRQSGQVDIFLHVWDELNSSDCFSVQQLDNVVNSNKLDEDYFRRLLNPTEMVVENFDQLKHNFTLDKYYKPGQRVHHAAYNHTSKIQYCLPMYYKWFQCNELKKKKEKDENFKYDLVVKCRSDIFFFRKMWPEEFDPNYIYMRMPNQDFLIFGSSEGIDKVTSVYNNLHNIINKYQCDYTPEQLLEYHMQENGLDHSKRREFGEYSCWVYPRRFFAQACFDILKRHGREDEYYGLFGKYGANLHKIKP